LKMYLVSDNVDTMTGLRLAGVEGVVVHKEDEVRKVINEILNDPQTGILLITEKLGKLVPDVIDDIKLNYHTPLVV